MALRCGIASRDITPAYSVYLHGYADRNHLSTGVAEPVQTACLALDDGVTRLLIVTLDMIGIEAPACEVLYQLIQEKTGVAYPHILLAGSHTHFAPALHGFASADPQVGLQEPDPRFVADVHTKVVEMAVESLRNLQPVALECARVSVPQVLFNRRTVTADGAVVTNYRYPSDADKYTFSRTDPELTVLRWRGETGLRAAWTNFGCHPVTGGRVQDVDHYRVSADYPHYLRNTISTDWSCPILFTLGAAGDAVPLDRYGDSRQRIGQSLGHAAVLAERAFRLDPEPRLAAEVVYLEAQTIIVADAQRAPAKYESARRMYANLRGSPGKDAGGTDYQRCAESYARALREHTRAALYPQNRWAVPTQFVRIGRTILVALPFEVLAEISWRMKERFPNSVLVSCAGGYQGYLPLAHEVPRSGYEVGEGSNHFKTGTADRLLEQILVHLEGDAGAA